MDIIPRCHQAATGHGLSVSRGPSGRSAYWRDVGTVDAFWEANLELIGVSPELNLYDRDWPIWTYQDQVPPAKFVFDDDGRRGMRRGFDGGGRLHRVRLLACATRCCSATSTCTPFPKSRIRVLLPDVEIGRHCVHPQGIYRQGLHHSPDTGIGVNPMEDAALFGLAKAAWCWSRRKCWGRDCTMSDDVPSAHERGAVWHMHQPEYRDLRTGVVHLPWTYLHAIKDYIDMAAHLEAVPDARAVVNFAPILLEQIEDYAGQIEGFLTDSGAIRDPVLAELAEPALPRGEQRTCSSRHCLRANHERMINRFAAYQRLATWRTGSRSIPKR